MMVPARSVPARRLLRHGEPAHNRLTNTSRGENTMKPVAFRQSFSRRRVLAGTAGLFSSAALAQKIASAQQPNANLGTPASVITNPPRDFARGHPSIYPDPDVIVVDPSLSPP